MSDSSSSSSGGIGFVGLLQVAFIVMKLCGVIDWTWLWVLSPCWISASILIALLVFAGVIWLLATAGEKGAK